MNKDVMDAINEINKKYGDNTLEILKDRGDRAVKRTPSGSIYLDKLLGVDDEGTGGFPLGRIVEIYGPEMSGKSSLCMKTIAEAQKRDFPCVYIDAEKTFEEDRATQLGIDTAELLVTQETHGEKVIDIIGDLVKQPYPGVIVIDSLTALVPQAEMEKSMQDSKRMALVAQMMSTGLRKINGLNKHWLVIFINQLRTNPGQQWGNPEYTPGGAALKYYSSVRLDLRKTGWIEDEEKKSPDGKKLRIGQVTSFKITKSKVNSPHQKGEYKYYYTTGEIDQASEIFNIGRLLGHIEKRGSMYDLCGESFRGSDSLEKRLREDQDFFEKAKKEILK